MASATNRPTVRPEAQPYFGKETAAPEKTPIQADYEALKRFPYRDISDKPSVYEEPGTGRTRPPKEGDTSKGSDGRPDFSTNKDAVVVYASNLLNLTTARENKEACCNLYSVMIDGKRHYFIGEVFIGERDNVVGPYLTDILQERIQTHKENLFKSFRYEGLMHSHPYSRNPNEFSGWPGDSTVPLLSGSIFLTTPDGTIYNLPRPDDILSDIFAAGMLMNSTITQNPISATTSIDFVNLLDDLKNWFNRPPTEPYHDLHSIDTTGISSYSPFSRDIPGVLERVKQWYFDKWYEQYMDERKITDYGVK